MNTWKTKVIARAGLALLLVVSSTPAQESERVKASKVKTLEIKVAHARIIFLSATGVDPGADLRAGSADDDTAGPFFVVKGDIVSVDGQPARGAFICRGVVFTSPTAPQEGGVRGVAQVNVTWDIDGRGILMGQSLEFRPGQPAGVVLGGTGEFERMLGTYMPAGAPAPLGDGNFTFTFTMRAAK